MPFELETPTTARIGDVIVLAEKDRAPDTNPGTGLDIVITTSNHILTTLDGRLRSTLYEKSAASAPAAKQGTLDGVEAISDLPNLTEIGKHLGQFAWDLELTGYTITIDQGLGEKSNIELGDCKLSKFSVFAKEGGSVVIKLRVESPDVNEKIHGKLALLKTREFPILLTAPEVVQAGVE